MLQFLDGQGHYATSDILKKWSASTTGNTINTGGNGPQGGNTIAGTSPGSLWMNKPVTGSPSTVIFGFWMKTPQLATATGVTCWRIREGSTVHVGLDADASGFIRAYRGDRTTLLGTAAAGAFVVNVGKYVQIKVTIHDSAGSVEIRVCEDGGTPTSVLNLTGIDTRNGATGICDQIDIFPATYISAGTNPRYLANVFIMDTTGSTNNDFLPTTWRVDTLFPSADGTYLEWAPSTGTTHFDLADESTPNTTDYNSSNTTNQRDTYAMGDLSAIGAVIYGIQVCSAMAASAAGAISAAGMIRSGSTDAVGTGTALSTSQTYLLSRWETDPATAAAWTESGVNALQAGGKVTSGGTPSARLSQTVVEVLRALAAPPAPAPPPAPTPPPLSTPLPSIVAPAPVPVFFVDGHGIEEDPVYAQVKYATGHHRARRLWTVSERAVTVEWQLEASELAEVEDWFENTLEAGTLPFSARVRNQMTGPLLVWWRARWIDFQTEMQHLGRGHVRGTLLLTGEPSDDGPVDVVGRVTEDDDFRVTEDGDTRIIE